MASNSPQRAALYQALGYAWQFGYTIVVPLILFGIGGRVLDRKFGTHPWLFVAGVVVSIAISSVALIVKALKIMRTIDAPDQTKPTTSDETDAQPHS